MVCLLGCSGAQPVDYSTDLLQTSLRAPRPTIHPERLAYRPRLTLRDSPGVRRALSAYLGKSRPFLVDALKRYPDFEQHFASIFTQYGIPTEVANLAIVESRLQPKVRSYRGAVGLWQFMPRTAQAHGLRVGLLRDERKDPIKSTAAAARYLQKLHGRFGDWFLVLAAYNCGPSRLARIIEQEGTNDFFELAERGAVSKETKNLVERFVAVSMILRNREAYGF